MRTFLRSMSLVAIPACMLITATADAGDDAREPLWAAVRGGDAKAVKALLDKGADVNAKSEIGITALWIAATKGHRDVVELLLAARADVNARDDIWYATPLSLAVSAGHAD